MQAESLYLRDLPSLPAHLVAALAGRRPIDASTERELNRYMRLLMARIRQARQAWEDLHGDFVFVEPPVNLPLLRTPRAPRRSRRRQQQRFEFSL